MSSDMVPASAPAAPPVSGGKRKAEPAGAAAKKPKTQGLPAVTTAMFLEGMHEVYEANPDMPRQPDAKLEEIYNKFSRPPTRRSWTAAEIRECTQYLKELGFRVNDPVELNQMLPPGARTRSGRPVAQANLFVWRGCGQQLGVNMDVLYSTLEATELDKKKWSRRAKPGANGEQNKVARHNCCFTDLEETPLVRPDPGDVTEHFVRPSTRKNHNIKFTNFAFAGELKKFRARYAAILGPFGYKFAEQFAELNKYYNKKTCGIGRHGDTERGHGAGAVNCLKVGYHIPMLFSWYKSCRPVGLVEPGAVDAAGVSFPVVSFRKKAWATKTMAAVVTLGHGDVYMMSEKTVGADWKTHDYALRHCAGARKYTSLDPEYYALVEQTYGDAFSSAYSLTFSDCVENDSETPELQFSTKYV